MLLGGGLRLPECSAGSCRESQGWHTVLPMVQLGRFWLGRETIPGWGMEVMQRGLCLWLSTFPARGAAQPCSHSLAASAAWCSCMQSRVCQHCARCRTAPGWFPVCISPCYAFRQPWPGTSSQGWLAVAQNLLTCAPRASCSKAPLPFAAGPVAACESPCMGLPAPTAPWLCLQCRLCFGFAVV